VVVQTPEGDPVDIDVNDDIWFLDLADDRLVTREPTGNEETGSVLWDATTGEAIADPLPCGSGDSAFLSSNTLMAAERIVNVNQTEISVCDADDGEELARRATPDETELPFEGSFGAALSPDGETVAIGSPNGTVTLVDLENGDVVETIPFDHDPDDGGIVTVQFGPDGRELLFATSFPGQVGVWSVGDAPDDVQVLDPDAERVTAVAMSPDGNRIAVAGKTAVTDAPTEIELLTRDGAGGVGEPLPWPYPGSEVFDLEYAADGSELYGTSFDGGLVRWAVTETSWHDLACRLAGRNLTRAEWDRYLPDTNYRATCPEWPDGE
jgi:WD40 repeat protein